MALSVGLLLVRQELERHLNQFDWTALTPGRKNILGAFLQVATAEGYAAVTMRTLGNALNIKPPSLYSHFPGGRDEIVTESLRWHYYNFGISVLEAIESATTAEEFLDAYIIVHITHQIQRPENNLWDILIASDRIGNFLQPDIRNEVNYWISLCAKLYQAAAEAFGVKDSVVKSRMALAFLDSASSWSDWNGTASDMPRVCELAKKSVMALFNMDIHSRV
ncbi:TetR/AcrR family transcriptional regulator [Pseudomonas sp. Teo4]|uniref:TetR/AcrR family transcriptional regulator n=1 Tax=Pseudomonas sp. Teo4 TaxID=3064528 RepID=UPI002ABB0090|nr:TetR/AcrR family transcriptional regulator [Pseudomonas sp. Teo4]MDZ3992562.1 hypothetical protein [Pseudomonas sp. Teo4]